MQRFISIIIRSLDELEGRMLDLEDYDVINIQRHVESRTFEVFLQQKPCLRK